MHSLSIMAEFNGNIRTHLGFTTTSGNILVLLFTHIKGHVLGLDTCLAIVYLKHHCKSLVRLLCSLKRVNNLFRERVLGADNCTGKGDRF